MNHKIFLIIIVVILLIIYNNSRSSAEYGKFVKISDMNVPRARHQAFLLQDGRVLILGGDENNSAEIFDPKTNKFTLKKGLGKHPYPYNTILLKNDKVLITGGSANRGMALNIAEIYDPLTDELTNISGMNFARYDHTSVLLKDGQVLIFGGYTGKLGKDSYPQIAEIYDPKQNKFISLNKSPNFEYNKPANVLGLNDGRILIVDNPNQANKAEIFDPKSNEFKLIGQFDIDYSYPYPSHLSLTNERFLTVEARLKNGIHCTSFNLYKFANDKIIKINTLIDKSIKLNTACFEQIDNERVLLTGGIRGAEGFLMWDTSESYIYNLNKNKLIKINDMKVKRANHNCINIYNTRILILGGYSQNMEIKTKKSEIFIPNYKK